MGRATRWFKALFGIKNKDRNEYSGEKAPEPTGFCHNPTTIPPNITPAEAAWLKSFYSSGDKEQNKHAIAVAAATAAAADAAVAAAQAAVAVVRLTSQGRLSGGSREKCAAVKIQTVFRGFLARKALRALKGLVKIQALVRGFLVRKQAAATLYSMQALVRAQASVRAEKLRRRLNNKDSSVEDERYHSSLHSRRLSASFEAAAATNPFDEIPKIVEVDTGCRPKPRSRRNNSWIQSPNFPDMEWGELEECYYSTATAQSTPRFSASCGCSGPVTPAKSVCAESYLMNYMAKTQSFKAKVRSHSAPKQRPEPGPKRRISLHEMMETRSSVRMQRSCSQAINFKNAVLGKIGRSSDFVFYPN